jgi:hypothetical protein
LPSLVRIAATVILLASLVACGPDALSKEEFTQRANRICREANEKSQALEPPSDPSDTEQLSEFIQRARAITENAIEKLRALDPPEEDRQEIDRMLDNLEEASGYLPEIQEAAENQDLDRFEEIARKIGAAANEAQEVADQYGLEECRSEPVVPGE